MKKFLVFLNKFFLNKQPEPEVQDMQFESSTIQDGKETIIHSLGKYWIKLVLDIDEENRKGAGTIQTNMKKKLTESDIIWLLKKYL